MTEKTKEKKAPLTGSFLLRAEEMNGGVSRRLRFALHCLHSVYVVCLLALLIYIGLRIGTEFAHTEIIDIMKLIMQLYFFGVSGSLAIYTGFSSYSKQYQQGPYYNNGYNQDLYSNNYDYYPPPNPHNQANVNINVNKENPEGVYSPEGLPPLPVAKKPEGS